MEITESKEFRDKILDMIAKREFSVRTGVHSSDLIYCLNKQALRKLEPKPDTAEEILRFSLGYASQRWLSGKLEDAEPVTVDGITVTPDVILDGVVWELKATFQSATKPMEDNLHQVRQVMCQCYVTRTREAYLTRLELMGNWKWVYRPSKPEKIAELVREFGENWAEHPTLHAWHLVFKQPELDHLWEIMCLRRDQYKGVLETGVLMPKSQAIWKGQEWECDWCAYKEKCR